MKSKKEQTKENIIESFWCLYENTRIEKITVKEIVLKAGYNRSTFYEYFKDVYDVLDYIENSLIPTSEIIPQITIGSTSIGADPLSQLEFFEKNKKYLKVLLGENGNPSFVVKLKNKIKEVILSSVNEMNRPENFEYILEYNISGMIGLLTYYIQKEEDIDINHIMKVMRKI